MSVEMTKPKEPQTQMAAIVEFSIRNNLCMHISYQLTVLFRFVRLNCLCFSLDGCAAGARGVGRFVAFVLLLQLLAQVFPEKIQIRKR